MIVTRLFGIPLAFYYALGRWRCSIWYVFTLHGGRPAPAVRRPRTRGGAPLRHQRVDRVRFTALVASCGLGALAGVIYAGTTGAADPSSGLTFLLPAFAAAFLGATSINPGRFNADRLGDRRLLPGHRHHRPLDPRHQRPMCRISSMAVP